MAEDNNATTSLTYDATGAQRGAAAFKAASDQIVQSERAVETAAEKTAGTVEKAETTKARVRKASAEAIAATGQAEVAAAAKSGVFAAATDRVVTSTSSQIKMLDTYARAWNPLGAAIERTKNQIANTEQLIAKGGPEASRAVSLLAEGQAKLARLQEALADASEGAGDSVEQEAQRLRNYASALNPLGVAVESARQRLEDLEQVAMSGGANAAKAIALIAGAQDQLTEAETRAAAGDQKLLTERKALERELDPIKTRSLEYAAALDRVDRAVQLNIINEKQAEVQRQRLTAEFAKANAPLGELNKKLDEHGKANGNAAFAQRQLGVQTVQFFSSVQGGAPIITALIQQGHQLLDVAMSTGTGFGVLGGAIKGAFGALTSPLGLMIAAGAALVTFGVMAETSARRLGTLREQLAGVRDNAGPAAQMAQDAARHLAATTSIGTHDAMQAGGTLLRVKEFQPDQRQLEALIKTADDLSIRLGEDLPASAERLRQGMVDPMRLIRDLSERDLKGFDQRLLDAAKHLIDAGHTGDAFDLVLAKIREAASGGTREITPLQQATAELAKALTSAGQSGKGLIDIVGGGLAGQLAEIVANIAKLITGIKEMVTWLEQHTPDWIKTAATAKIPSLGDAAGGWLHRQMTGGGAAPGSGGGVAPGPGGVLMDQTGAPGAGMFQLQPDAARDVGLTPEQRFDYGLNIVGGLRYFRQQYDATNNIDDATRAYNAGLGGAQAGKGQEYLASVRGQDINKLPAQARADIETAFGTIFSDLARSAMGGPLRERILQIAMQESGGHHYDTRMRTGTPGEGALTGRGAAPGGATVTPSGLGNKDPLNEALTLADTMGTTAKTRLEAIDQIEKLRNGLAKLNSENKQGSPEWERINQALRQAQLNLQNAVEPSEKLTQSLDRQTANQQRIADAYGKGSAAVAEATARAKALEEARELEAQGTQVNIQLVETLTQKYLAQANAEQNTELGKKMADIDAEVAAQNRLNEAYAKGGAAVMQVTAANQAAATAREMARAGLANEDEATAALTAANLAKAQAAARGPLSQQMAVNDNQVTLLKAEGEALMMNEAARAQYIAGVQAEIALKTAGLPVNDAWGQSYVRSAQAVAAAGVALETQRRAVSELDQTFSQIGDTLSQALTTPLKEGETAATRFKNTMVSVLDTIAKELLKLAVINPILNALNPSGQQRPVLGDVISAYGGAKDNSGGMLGSAVNSVGGQGFYQGGGLIGSLFSSGGAGAGAAGGAGAAAAGGTFSNAALLAGQVGLYHGGGLVGIDPPSFYRFANPAIFDGAPRLHAGFNEGLGADEFSAILQRGERVLTAGQQKHVMAAANDRGRDGGHTFNFSFPSSTNADGFRRAGTQVASQVNATLARNQVRSR